MVLVLLALAAVLIIAIGFYAVGHAVGATEKMPAQIVVDVHEAIEFCAEALPDEVTATLSYDELRRLLRLHLEWIQAYHWTPETVDASPIVFEQFDALDYVMERVEVTDLEVSRDHAAAVIQAHSDFLQVMGAIHLDDPVKVEQDLATLPLLDNPAAIELGPGEPGIGDDVPSNDGMPSNDGSLSDDRSRPDDESPPGSVDGGRAGNG